MKKTENEFDESVLENEKEFKRRFKQISRAERPNVGINTALKGSKDRITIYLDADIVEYFKMQTRGRLIGYQTLINQALREMIDGTKPPADDPIESLLNDTSTLRRLKARLEKV